MNVFSKSTLYVFPFYYSLPTWCSTARFSIQFSRVIFDTCFSQDNMKNLPNKTGPENFLYYIVSWWNNYFKLWLRKEEFFVEDKWHFVQNRFLLFVSLCSVFFFFFTLIKMIITISNSQVQGFIWMNKNEKGTLNKTKFVKGCFSHVQALTSLVRWLNKVFCFKAS